MSKFFIPVVLGTARSERRSQAVFDFVLGELKKRSEFEVVAYDVRDFMIGQTVPPEAKDSRMSLWKQAVQKADGLIVVSPEYNHGYPGELKIVLDSLYEEYNKKPVGICSVSDGMFGGARMVEQLREIFSGLGMSVIKSPVYFAKVKELFNEHGVMENPKDLERYQNSLKKMFDELVWYAQTLKYGREHFGI